MYSTEHAVYHKMCQILRKYLTAKILKNIISIHLEVKCRQLESENIVRAMGNDRTEGRYEGGRLLSLWHMALNGLQMPRVRALTGSWLYCIDNDRKGRQYPYRMLDGQSA